MNTDTPLILIVDDDEAMRRSMRFLFASAGLDAQAWADGDGFLRDLPAPGGPALRPGALILDVRMPGMSGLELQAILAEREFPLPVVIVTGHGDVQMAVTALKAGAFDFIEKPFKEQHLLDMVEAAIRLSRDRLASAARRHEIAARLDRLSPREREVLDGILRGEANKVMAQDLGLSIKTVEGYRAAVMTKMQAGSLAELVRLVGTLSQGEPQPGQGQAQSTSQRRRADEAGTIASRQK